jgi:hypothetical protein
MGNVTPLSSDQIGKEKRTAKSLIEQCPRRAPRAGAVFAGIGPANE